MYRDDRFPNLKITFGKQTMYVLDEFGMECDIVDFKKEIKNQEEEAQKYFDNLSEEFSNFHNDLFDQINYFETKFRGM